MSEKSKPSFWDRLLGREPRPAPEPERETPPAPAESEETPSDTKEADAPASAPRAAEVPDTPDAGPPETQAEWVRHGHPNPPEDEPDTPDSVTDPFETGEALEERGRTAEPFDPELEPDVPAMPESEPEPAPPPEPEPAPPAQEAPAPAPEPEKRKSWFARLSDGLKRSSDNLTASIGAVFTKRRLDNATLQDLEDILIQADLGTETAIAITDRLRADKFDKDIAVDEVEEALAREVESVLDPVAVPLSVDAAKSPFVILMVGVNGSGKTTTIGKLTAKYRAEGHSVLLAAGDTFRAAAVEQLQVWGERNQTEVLTRPTGADASGLAFDALKKAQADGTDILIIDTAGRLQNRTELMDELEKIIRVLKKIDPEAPHASVLTLDATTGQNALNQVEIFSQKAGVTGLVMTKLDGTARGGILVAIARKFGLPIHYIGVGESIGDLEPFKARDFARAMIGRTPAGRE